MDRRFCLGCKPAPRTTLGFETLGAYGLLGLLGWLFVAAKVGLEPLGLPLLALGGLKVSTPITLAVHEFGHAGMAALIGRRVYKINVGSGMTLKTFRILHTQLVIGRDMGAGYVVELPIRKASRFGSISVLLAGAMANFLFAACLMFLAASISREYGAAAAVVGGAILSNVLTGVGALTPNLIVIDGHSLPSDGRSLWSLISRKPSNEDLQVEHDAFKGMELLHAKLWHEAEAHYRDAIVRHPDRPYFLGNLLHVISMSKGYAAATLCAEEHDAYIRQERGVSKDSAPLWSYAWGISAWVMLRSHGSRVAKAEALSQKALQADPHSPYAKAVWAAMLTRTGNRDELLSTILDALKDFESFSDKLEFLNFIIDDQLESADFSAADFRMYASHLRTLV